MTNQIISVPYISNYKVSPNVLSPTTGRQPLTASATTAPPRPQKVKTRSPSFSTTATTLPPATTAVSGALATPPHKRSYQACIPCRRRKVRCDLGSVEAPHSPPCARCRRESKECFFSATRRRSAGEAMGEDEGSISGASDAPKRKRLRSNTPSDSALYPAVLPTTLPTKPPNAEGASKDATSPRSEPRSVDEDTPKSSMPDQQQFPANSLSQPDSAQFAAAPVANMAASTGLMDQAFGMPGLGYDYPPQGASLDALMMKFFAVFVRMSRNINADPKNATAREGSLNSLFQEFMMRFFATLNQTTAFSNNYAQPTANFQPFPGQQSMNYTATPQNQTTTPLRTDNTNALANFGDNTEDLDLFNEGLILGGNSDDWLGVPMDPLFGNAVGQSQMAPDVGGMDLLDLLMEDGSGGVLN